MPTESSLAPQKLWIVHVALSTDVFVAAATKEAAELIAGADPDISDELRDLDPLCFARPVKVVPPAVADTLPYGLRHDDPRRDWTLTQWKEYVDGQALANQG